MHIQKLSIKGSPFIGVFAKASDQFALVPTGISAKEKKIVQKTLEVDTIETRIGNSSIIGALCIANSKHVVLPSIAEEREIDALTQSGVRAVMIDGVEALGNQVCINDHTGLCGHALSEKTKRQIEKALHIELTRVTIANSDLVGSASVLTNKGFAVHSQTRTQELEILKKITGLNGNPASANYGDGFLGNGAIANSFGALVGDKTTGYELMAIDDALQ